MVLVIVEIVALPVAGVVERTGEHGSQSVVESGVFKLCEYAFLCGEPVVIPVDNIAYSEFLGTYNGTSLSNTSWYGASQGVLSTLFRCADGTFDYAAIQEMNENSTTGL